MPNFQKRDGFFNGIVLTFGLLCFSEIVFGNKVIPSLEATNSIIKSHCELLYEIDGVNPTSLHAFIIKSCKAKSFVKIINCSSFKSVKATDVRLAS